MRCTKGCCRLKTWKLPKKNKKRSPARHLPKTRRAGVILSYKEKVLVVRSWDEHNWGFPKGGIENGETDECSASRELLEETGILLSPEFILKNSAVWKIRKYVFFVLKLDYRKFPAVEKIKAIPNNDSSGVGWVNVECMLKNRNLPCNYSFRMFLAGVNEKGLDKWLSEPNINDGVYKKYSVF